jgi:ATP-dependent DNA helicase DinG
LFSDFDKKINYPPIRQYVLHPIWRRTTISDISVAHHIVPFFIIVNDEGLYTMTSELQKSALSFLENEITGALEGYEVRRSQAEMTGACSEVIEKGGVLVVEAGTGTGKTFAYLIPAVLSGQKVIVSTRTKNLQEQLVGKDLKFLASLKDFDYALAKGRSNYLCLRRLHAYIPAKREEVSDYEMLMEWASETDAGDFEDFYQRDSTLLERVCSDSDACRKSKCQYFRQCFYYRARAKWENAHILVVNHALFSINALMPDDSKILPEADVLILDEAHALDNVLSSQIGITLSVRRFESIMNRLLKLEERGVYRGLLAKSPDLFPVIESLRSEMGLFWIRIKETLRDKEIINDSFILRELMQDLAESMRSCIEAIKASVLGLFQEDEEIELTAAIVKLHLFAFDMETFAPGMDGFVRWSELDDKKIALRMIPVYPKDFVTTNIVPAYETIILTSATLSVNKDFSLITDTLGLAGAETKTLPSPFDMQKQVRIEIKRGINLLGNGEGIEKLAKVILDEAAKKEGGVLVLFTSRKVMDNTWDMVYGDLMKMGLFPMKQGGDMANKTMLEAMRDTTKGVILGLDSFWEGVDIRGNSLKTVVITKLPFLLPTEPIVVAREEALRKAGRNPFYEYMLPAAVLKFKQGFGRLIRSKEDEGRVIICDERIRTQRYGQRFLESIS